MSQEWEKLLSDHVPEGLKSGSSFFLSLRSEEAGEEERGRCEGFLLSTRERGEGLRLRLGDRDSGLGRFLGGGRVLSRSSLLLLKLPTSL